MSNVSNCTFQGAVLFEIDSLQVRYAVVGGADKEVGFIQKLFGNRTCFMHELKFLDSHRRSKQKTLPHGYNHDRWICI